MGVKTCAPPPKFLIVQMVKITNIFLFGSTTQHHFTIICMHDSCLIACAVICVAHLTMNAALRQKTKVAKIAITVFSFLDRNKARTLQNEAHSAFSICCWSSGFPAVIAFRFHLHHGTEALSYTLQLRTNSLIPIQPVSWRLC